MEHPPPRDHPLLSTSPPGDCKLGTPLTDDFFSFLFHDIRVLEFLEFFNSETPPIKLGENLESVKILQCFDYFKSVPFTCFLSMAQDYLSAAGSLCNLV